MISPSAPHFSPFEGKKVDVAPSFGVPMLWVCSCRVGVTSCSSLAPPAVPCRGDARLQGHRHCHQMYFSLTPELGLCTQIFTDQRTAGEGIHSWPRFFLHCLFTDASLGGGGGGVSLHAGAPVALLFLASLRINMCWS